MLIVEGRDRPPGEASAVSLWLERNPTATRVAVAGRDDAVFAHPWPEAVAAWVGEVGRAARR
jgi:hypothetical protein